MLKLCSKLLLATLPFLLSNVAHAEELKNPDGFNTPLGYALSASNIEEYGLYSRIDNYECLPKLVLCTQKDQIFDERGYPRIEGKLEKTTYTRSDGKAVEGFLIQKNYEDTIKQMGGRLFAVMNGEDVRRGQMHHIHLIEKNGQRKWVLIDTRSDTYKLSLLVITQIEMPKILEVGEFQKQLDTQGYVTLNVNFDNNKSAIRAEDKPTLNQVVQLLKASPKLRLSVDGHTDNVGNAAANKTLSQQRSEAIVAYLVGEGIEKSRLVAKGFGSENPIADNRSEDGRAKNRRVELVKLK
jgi:OmpA-OmpF porin, OOP family